MNNFRGDLTDIPAKQKHWGCRLLPGPQNRREGGQGVVVFATTSQNSDLWAIKFFLSQRHFAEERAMYEDPVLSPVLPEVRCGTTDEVFSILNSCIFGYIDLDNILYDNINN